MITIELLKSWEPCKDGFKRFCELFPEGADLKTAADGLLADGHGDWGAWLYARARERDLFADVTILGFANTGHRNTGHRNTGHRNTGHRNTGGWNTGHQNTGHWNTGDRNTGDRNTGGWNTGDRNTGGWNTGDQNTGDWNTGHQNTGHQNTGGWNTGHQNTGHQNTGHQNTGGWNTGHQNTGCFNTITPNDILVFNKSCDRVVFENAYKPAFLFFAVTYWVNDSEMTDAEKAADPNFYARGGQLREIEYKQAFIESWNAADPVDRERVRELPNFDAQVFFEISGIDLRE